MGWYRLSAPYLRVTEAPFGVSSTGSPPSAPDSFGSAIGVVSLLSVASNGMPTSAWSFLRSSARRLLQSGWERSLNLSTPSSARSASIAA